jgi:hypothetical protein
MSRINRSRRPAATRLAALLGLALAGLSLGGCVVYEPAPHYHHRPYGYY